MVHFEFGLALSLQLWPRLTKTLSKTYGVVSETIRLFSHHSSWGDGNETKKDPTRRVIEPCWLSVSFRPRGKARSAWFFGSSARAPSLRNFLRDGAVERQDIERC